MTELDAVKILNDLANSCDRKQDGAFWILVSAAAYLTGHCDDEGSATKHFFWDLQQTAETPTLKPALDEDGTAYGALLILDYLQELFLASGRETFSKEQVMIALNLVKNDPEVLAPEAVLAYELATEEIQNG